MAQIGLADTLKLLAAGYKKKDIEALASIDSAKDPKPDPEPDPKPDPKPDPEPDPKPDPEPDPKPDPEPDYKALLEAKEKELKEIQEKLTKAQADNTHKDSTASADEAKKKEAETLTNLVRSFM